MKEDKIVVNPNSFSFILLIPVVFQVVEIINGKNSILDIVITWFVSTLVIMLLFGFTAIVRRIEIDDVEIKIVYLLRSKVVKIKDGKFFDSNKRNIIIRRENGSILFTISKSLIKKDDYDAVKDFLSAKYEN